MISAICTTLIIAGAAVRSPLLVIGAYMFLMYALARTRSLLKAIDRGDLPSDGRKWAVFAWMLATVSSVLAFLALLRAMLG